MKKISIFIIVLSAATLMGFTFDYIVHATKLQYFQKQAEILKNKYNNDEPSIDYTEVKRQRDSLYFVLNPEKIIAFGEGGDEDFRQEIYFSMSDRGYQSTYDEFIEVVSGYDQSKAKELYNDLKDDKIFTGTFDDFMEKFYGIRSSK